MNQPMPFSVSDVQPTAAADRRLAGILALALGVVIVFATGFAPSEAMHNAAHDTRHSAALPCH